MTEAEKPTAAAIVDRMMERDKFSRWLGIEVVQVSPGRCLLTMTVTPEMCNGFGIAHGGISYSLSDSALAFAANAHGRVAVTANTSISHLEKVEPGDRLSAKAEEIHAGKRLARYRVEITKNEGLPVAAFEGTVYLTSKNWENE